MHVAEIWRYPVKTMGGERLQRAMLGMLGIPGDRIVHVEDARGRVVTSRSHPRFLGHHATMADMPLVDGRPWDSEEVARDVAAIAGEGARLVHDESEERFDVLPLLIATDGAIAAFGHDHRRLRPNLVIAGVEGLAERDWPGRTLRIGSAVIGVQELRTRCIMTSYDPDTQEQDKSITRGIYERFGGRLALDCFVIEPGEVGVGDGVQVGGAL
ncbi:MAG TPA: MOSC N-terminal beta barrel domain-containing protein [Thermoanaerobaculia bacterium]|nr:MOSC N-terminal beta barrel domain-containing protein [Thermoanaerobaculia bacterium]